MDVRFLKWGITSVCLQFIIRQTSGLVMSGANLNNTTAGFTIGTLALGEATGTSYVGGTSLDAVSTIGSYAAPAGGHANFSPVDPTNAKGLDGWFELQLADARFGYSTGGGAKAKWLIVNWSGANTASDGIIIRLPLTDVDDALRGGLLALPSVPMGSGTGQLMTYGSAPYQMLTDGLGGIDIGQWLGQAVTLDAHNLPNTNAKDWGGTIITAASIPVGTAAGTSGGLPLFGAVAGGINTDGAGNLYLSRGRKNTAYSIAFAMYLTGTKTPATGKTVSIALSKDNGAFVAATTATAPEAAAPSNGYYLASFTATEMNANNIGVQASASGCDVTEFTIQTQG
jgi:hypothetical protein